MNKKAFIGYILLFVIGILTISMAIAIFLKTRIPLYEDSSLMSVLEIQHTPFLEPGDTLTQDFRSIYDSIEKISIAVSYQEDTAKETEFLIELISESEIILSQKLSLFACPDNSFADFQIQAENCKGKTFTVSISNVTDSAVENAGFSMMSSDKEYLYPDSIDRYSINGIKTDESIFFRTTYRTGFSYYKAFAAAFFILLSGAIAAESVFRYFLASKMK